MIGMESIVEEFTGVMVDVTLGYLTPSQSHTNYIIAWFSFSLELR